ncbi:2617_t:CDS:2 [Ambispora leptoticha]|uniref:RNA helicase n=1 Tax=Ambispora leptoticha TaxID=144679 RepID=A0A9N9D3M0_9GLOM|nr:2617_t:CDS:2 [Ambispora leptoticha]
MFVPRIVQKRPKSSVDQKTRQEKRVKIIKHDIKNINSTLEEDNKKEEETIEIVTDLGEKVIENKRRESLSFEEIEKDDEEPIKEHSMQQRNALPGEPICVVCGRYGEYICDETDHDVCSIECKKIDIKLSKITPATAAPNNAPIEQQSPIYYTYPQIIAAPLLPLSFQNPTSDLLHVKLTGYFPHPEISCMTESQLFSILSRNQINCLGKHIPRPILSFAHCRLPEKIYDNLQQIEIHKPTPIQMGVIPAGLAGRDILASAATGSGKTASFLIPIIVHSFALSQYYQSGGINDSNGGPYALIIAPSRELCAQIEQHTKSLIQGLPNMKTALLIGGYPIPNQIHRLQQRIQIAIATPGRFLDIYNQCKAAHNFFANIHILVLDEVDMMFKMGFETQLMEILENLQIPLGSSHRQTLMFSATIPKNIESVASSVLRDPIKILIGGNNKLDECMKKFENLSGNNTIANNYYEMMNTNETKLNSMNNNNPILSVKQTILWVENKSKKKQLFSILNDPKYYNPPIVIFVESKLGADLLSKAIEKKWPETRIASIHGDKVQEERTQVLQAFLAGEYDIIVSTGVLSRGLNLTNVRMVVLFDMAVSVDEYIHQVGRATNKGSQGWAVTFINEDHKKLFKEFVKMLKSQPPGKVTPLPSKLLGHGYTLLKK